MKEITGDLWEQLCDARCITTNGTVTNKGAGVMGRGVARQAKVRYPGIEARLGQLVRRYGNHTQLLVEEGVPLVALPVKHEWPEKADLLLIKRSCTELVALADKHLWHTIVLPRPGCGNGKLHWDQVERVIAPILDERFVVVYAGTGDRWEA